ncbi:hypothetical protein ABEP00_07460 [Heyndrickxia sporothermodurans]|nr:hypothetical protein [Heyndrickxia sporothermodurans]
MISIFNDLEIISRPFFCATGNRTGQKAAMKKLVDNYDINAARSKGGAHH